MKNYSQWQKILICVFPFIAVCIILIFRNNIRDLGYSLPSCPSYTIFGIYCPGCGNTRSVQSLLSGNIVDSLKFNVFPIFGIVFISLAYVEFVINVFGRHVRLIPRNRRFWINMLILFIFYYILRNFIHLF